MEHLCRDYWQPSYAFLRARGLSPVDAQDIVQEFFSRKVFSEGFMSKVSPEKGRFRSLVMVALKNFSTNKKGREGAEKRGGKASHVSLGADDWAEGEAKWLAGQGHSEPPDIIFDRAHAFSVLDRVWRRLYKENPRNAKSGVLDEVLPLLPDRADRAQYEAIASKMSKSADALAMEVSRLRLSFHQILRSEVQKTVQDPADVDDEIRYLLKLWGQAGLGVRKPAGV